MVTLVFLLVDQMHERYLYMGSTCFVLAACLRPRVRGTVLAAAATILSGLNQSLFLDFHAATNGYHVPSDTVWLRVLAVAHLVFGAVVVQSAWCRAWMHRGPRPFSLEQSGGTGAAERNPLPGRRYASLLRIPRSQPVTRAEALAIAFVSLLGGILGFFYLGNTSAPLSWWRPGAASVQQGQVQGQVQGDHGPVVRRYRLEPPLGPEQGARIVAFFGLGKGHYVFRSTADPRGGVWSTLGRLGHDSVFDAMSWRSLAISPQGHPVTEIEVIFESKSGDTLAVHEMALFTSPALNRAADRVQLLRLDSDASGGVDPFTDEPHAIPERPSFLDEMIFDEVYHARSAWEEIVGVPITETSHPPLGKTLIGLGISLFGMNTLGWRSTGVLASVLSLPLVWFILRTASGCAAAALLAAWFYCFDFLRHTQSRMATLDSIAVLFVLAAMACLLRYASSAQTGQRQRWLWLVSGGVCFGLGLASKWSVLYVAPLLGLLFLFASYHLFARRSAGFLNGVREQLLPDVLLALLSFCVVPLCLYYGAFWLSHGRSGEPCDWVAFWERQISMFRYHSDLQATHPFSSSWWEWPFGLRPLWLYSGSPSPEGVHAAPLVRSIVSMGNPLTWWTGLVAMAWLVFGAARALMSGRDTVQGNKHSDLSGCGKPSLFPALFVLVCALGLYLPWVVAPRKLTFIYHYLPVVPFVMMALSLWITSLAARSGRTGVRHERIWSSAWVLGSAFGVALSFIFYFPVLSGTEVSRHFIDAWLRILPRWDF